MGFSHFHWFWCSLDSVHSKGICIFKFQPESLNVNLWLERYCLKCWKPSRHFGYRFFVKITRSRFTAWPWKSQHQKVFINLWANNLSTGNAGKGHAPVSVFIPVVRKHSSVLLFTIFLFALKAHRKSRSQCWGFFLKYSTLFNQRLEAVSASDVFILFV